jgi:hypothetical protein
MATVNAYDTAVTCSDTGTNKQFTDPMPDEVTYDYSEAVKCLFCCCCSGSGSGSGNGSGSGSGTGSTPGCCPPGTEFGAYGTFSIAFDGDNYGDRFEICSDSGGSASQELTLVNNLPTSVDLYSVSIPIEISSPCSVTTESWPLIQHTPAVSIPAAESVVETMTFDNLRPCCVYTVHYYASVTQTFSAGKMASPSSVQVVDTGVEPTKGTQGIVGPRCMCYCEEKAPEIITKSVSPIVPLAESGFAVSHEFIDLPGEINCRYLWKLHITWIGQGEGYLFARDRCSVLHIDKRSRDSADPEFSPPTEEFDYQLLVCGPTTVCLQMKSKVVDGVSRAGRVTMQAERVECMWGSNRECCCGPYPACLCDPEVAPVVTCQSQKENLPIGWQVDEAAGRLVAGRTDDVTPVIGLAYTVHGDISCAYRVRVELEMDVGADCIPIFMGGDYAAVTPGEDGRGRLYADLWVCGGTVFTLLLSGQGGEATFKVAYAGESRAQTPICCP